MTANEQAAGDAANRLTKKIADARRLDAEATPGPWYAPDGDGAGTVGTGDGDTVCSDNNILAAAQADFDFIAHARNHHAALWNLVEVVCKHGGHKGCDDGFYACPKSGDYFGRWEHLPVEERQCECGWDDISAALARLEQVKP